MSFIHWLFEGKIIQKRPCEKVSFVFGGSIIALATFVVLMVYNLYMVPEWYIAVAVFGVVGGYIGVLMYRFMKHKKPLFIFNPWKKY